MVMDLLPNRCRPRKWSVPRRAPSPRRPRGIVDTSRDAPPGPPGRTLAILGEENELFLQRTSHNFRSVLCGQMSALGAWIEFFFPGAVGEPPDRATIESALQETLARARAAWPSVA